MCRQPAAFAAPGQSVQVMADFDVEEAMSIVVAASPDPPGEGRVACVPPGMANFIGFPPGPYSSLGASEVVLSRWSHGHDAIETAVPPNQDKPGGLQP